MSKYCKIIFFSFFYILLLSSCSVPNAAETAITKEIKDTYGMETKIDIRLSQKAIIPKSDIFSDEVWCVKVFYDNGNYSDFKYGIVTRTGQLWKFNRYVSDDTLKRYSCSNLK